MDVPKCRACGKREWNHVCALGRAPKQQASADVEVTGGDDVASVTGSAAEPADGGRGSDLLGSTRKRSGKGTFDRAAYQKRYMKEYMRKRRAADKLAKQ